MTHVSLSLQGSRSYDMTSNKWTHWSLLHNIHKCISSCFTPVDCYKALRRGQPLKMLCWACPVCQLAAFHSFDSSYTQAPEPSHPLKVIGAHACIVQHTLSQYTSYPTCPTLHLCQASVNLIYLWHQVSKLLCALLSSLTLSLPIVVNNIAWLATEWIPDPRSLRLFMFLTPRPIAPFSFLLLLIYLHLV